MGERAFIIHSPTFLYSTSSHHPIIPSPHHPLFTYQALLLFSPYTITDLSFGVVPGGNPALSPVLTIDAGSTSKRSNSELSSGAVCGNRTHDHMVKSHVDIIDHMDIIGTQYAEQSPNQDNEHKYSLNSKAGQYHI